MNLTPQRIFRGQMRLLYCERSMGDGHSSALPNDEPIDPRESSSGCWAVVAFPLGPRDRGRSAMKAFALDAMKCTTISLPSSNR